MALKAEIPLSVRSTESLTGPKMLALYRTMVLSRRLDDREILLKRQQRIFFQISSAGHEAVTAAAGDLLRPKIDWVYPYYRDRALCLQLGVTPEEMLMEAVGAAADPNSGGRQMPSHFGHREWNIVSQSSCTGTQFTQAVGCAAAGRYLQTHGTVDAWAKEHTPWRLPIHHPDEVTLVSSGEGATSQGEFWEGLGTACRERLPVLFLIENNGYAISVPAECQGAGADLPALLGNFPHLLVLDCDGCDLVESHRTLAQALDYCRSGQGPALVHARVIRPYSHSLSDDERLYRPEEEREADAQRDPIPRLRRQLESEGIASAEELDRIEADVDRVVLEATDAALAAPIASLDSIYQFVYSPDVDPTSERFDGPSQPSGAPQTMVDLINACLREEMERDPRIVVFGEDVADCTREQYLEKVKGKGGVFKVTGGLQRRFGPERVYNSALAEASIVGRAVGLATRGLKPVAEIQFFDYIWPAMMQLRNELALMRWRSNNAFTSPAVVRVPIGGYLTGGAIYHSQSGEVIFTHLPGLRVVFPSTAVDAYGLLRTALRADDPVMFLEHKRLYREPFNRGAHPGRDFSIPFGRARIARAGSDLTIVTYGALVQRSLQAAERLAHEGKGQVEVIDLRSLSPYDWECIATSVRKTSRAIVAYEDMRSWGYGAEIAARIGDELFDDLDAPVRRVAATDTFCAYQPALEDVILPQSEDVYRAAGAMLAY